MDTGWVNGFGEISVVNETSLADAELSPMVRELAQQLKSWTNETRARTGDSNLFDRSKFVAPDNPYDQFRVARRAVSDDDVIGTAAEISEGLILQEVRWESPNEDIADVFNQLNGTLNLDEYLRVLYREMFTYSQAITATWWGWRSYLPRSRKGGASKRKPVTLWVPIKIITLDPMRIVPIGMTIFGEDRLAWNASTEEVGIYSGAEAKVDVIMEELFLGTYKPGKEEGAELTALGVNIKALLEFNPERVWRHSNTRSSYDRFAEIRLRSTFRLLDLKQQLMESDRVNLVGAANYILLIKQGTDAIPGQAAEVTNLKENFKVIARLPVIVSDHRLNIEIITPATDYTLVPERYDLLDRRIAARALGALDIGAGDGNSQAAVSSRMVARGLENKRQMMRRMVELRILKAVWKHPRNKDALASFKPDEKPSLAFTPRHVQLDNDALMIQAIMSARQAEEISRPSFLEWMGFDEDVEAQRRARSKELYPDWKQTVPFNSPANSGDGSKKPGTPATNGATGGRPAGGGTPKKSAQGTVKPRTGTGNTSTGK